MCFGIGRDRQSGGTLMAFPRKLYAVVSHASQPVIRKPNVLEIRTNKLQELKTKKVIDRANAVLDRLEQRVAHYDGQILLLCEQYLKPLEQRRACAQQRIDRLEDQILAKLSEANLERVDGFCRELQAVSCPKAVQVDNLSLIPNEYIRHKPEADKIAIKRALERDRDLVIPGVHLTQKLRLVRK
jgi:Siphovirus Gp157